MKSDLPIEVTRFKEVRESMNMTQQSFADALGIKNSTADIERGKSKITGGIVAELLDKFGVNPLWLYGKSHRKTLEMTVNTSPKVITVDNDNNDNIVLVNVKAAAGYPHNLQDVDWYEELPAFQLPLNEFRNATYRGFQVQGDSMLPNLYPGEWVLGRAVESLSHLDNHAICVVILQDSVLVKKVQKHPSNDQLSLISINTEYPPITVNANEIQEIWQVKSKISMELEHASSDQGLEQIQQAIQDLRKDIEALKN